MNILKEKLAADYITSNIGNGFELGRKSLVFVSDPTMSDDEETSNAAKQMSAQKKFTKSAVGFLDACRRDLRLRVNCFLCDELLEMNSRFI